MNFAWCVNILEYMECLETHGISMNIGKSKMTLQHRRVEICFVTASSFQRWGGGPYANFDREAKDLRERDWEQWEVVRNLKNRLKSLNPNLSQLSFNYHQLQYPSLSIYSLQRLRKFGHPEIRFAPWDGAWCRPLPRMRRSTMPSRVAIPLTMHASKVQLMQLIGLEV